MAARSGRLGPLAAARDRREFADLPLDFVHRQYLVALGVATQGDDGELHFKLEGLAGYRPPATPIAGLLIQPQTRDSIDARTGDATGRYTVMGPVRDATRLDPVAARWLWHHRVPLETDPALDPGGIVNRAAWCVHCGHLFESDANLGTLRPIAQWCEGCATRRTRKNPQLRGCAARDCDHWFRPKTGGQVYCRPACEQADRRRRRAA